MALLVFHCQIPGNANVGERRMVSHIKPTLTTITHRLDKKCVERKNYATLD